MPGYGTTACVLIRLDARTGQWVPLLDLAAHLAMPVPRLAEHCLELQRGGLLSLQREGADGPITHARTELRGA